MSKKAFVKNKYSTDDAIGGSTITYDLNVSTRKNKQVKCIEVIDFIPKHTDYINNSLRVDNKRVTDAIDLDGGYYDKKENKVVINFDQIKYPEVKKIKFDVRLR